MKKEECDQRDLNFLIQFKTLISCLNIYFLGMRAPLLHKLAIRNSPMGKKRHDLQFLRVEF